MKASALISSILFLTGQAMGASDMTQHNITIYSKATPGAINPAMFEAQVSNPNARIKHSRLCHGAQHRADDAAQGHFQSEIHGRGRRH